ncbi:MAG: PaaI family thioesterase, partial [Anaerolineales bacterium]|nr:PaaI family thioesterase [Anaerolineales bacterium]
IGFDQDEGWLRTRFPVKPEYLNPYRTMQGGMIAAAVDNTLGPLSMLVASPNVTRRLEMKFSRPVRADMHHILVLARFIGRENQELRFTAEVRSEDGLLLARARATHWISRED